MMHSKAQNYVLIMLFAILTIFLTGWLADNSSSKVQAQELFLDKKEDIGRYQFQYVPSENGSAPSYIVFDTATGDFWQGKGFIENLDDFVVYSRSNLTEGLIGGHNVKIHKHK